MREKEERLKGPSSPKEGGGWGEDEGEGGARGIVGAGGSFLL